MSASPAPNPRVAASPGRAWWLGAPIYQIYPYSFADSNDDGVGDLAGIAARLDHVASLGVAAIWLSPFFTSPMRDFGYDIADYRNVDPRFGSLADFDRLVERAHALGLKVIIDQVYSHTSDQHEWFRESRASRDNPRADWYVWADARPDGSPPSNWQSMFGGPAWTWDARRGQYYLHNFLAGQPDLNVHNRRVQDELLECARFWLDRGVDGFRLDAVNFTMHDPQLRDNPPAPSDGRVRTRPCDFQLPLYSRSHPDIPLFIERIRELVDSYRDRFTVAEVGGADAEAEMKSFTAGTKRFHSAYGFNFLQADRLTPRLVEQALAAWPDVDGIGWPSWAFSNHDAPRAPSRWASTPDRAAMARVTMLLLACLRGNIFIYQGEELGLPQAHVPFEQLKDPEAIANWPLTLGRDGARTPIPWRSSMAPATNAHAWLPVACRAPRTRRRPAGARSAFATCLHAPRAGYARQQRRAAGRHDEDRRGFRYDPGVRALDALTAVAVRLQPRARCALVAPGGGRAMARGRAVGRQRGWALPRLSGWVAEWIE